MRDCQPEWRSHEKKRTPDRINPVRCLFFMLLRIVKTVKLLLDFLPVNETKFVHSLVTAAYCMEWKKIVAVCTVSAKLLFAELHMFLALTPDDRAVYTGCDKPGKHHYCVNHGPPPLAHGQKLVFPLTVLQKPRASGCHKGKLYCICGCSLQSNYNTISVYCKC